MIMTEIPMALWGFAAALSFARFLEKATVGSALGFTFFSVLAIMTKGNGFALALVPPLAIVLAGRYDALKRGLLWGSGVLVGLFCLPWYLVTVSGTSSTWGSTLSPEFVRTTLASNLYTLLVVGGTVVAALAIVGIVSGLRSDDRSFWAVVVSWIMALVVLHTLIPVGPPEQRFMVPALPAWFVCAIPVVAAQMILLHLMTIAAFQTKGRSS